jgi:hypothetical protein
MEDYNMTRISFAGVIVIALMAVVFVGCQQPKIDMSEMMKAPARPAELDHLEMLVGRWEGDAEMKVVGCDEVMTGEGVETVSWDADKWLLVSHFEYKMGDGDPMKGIGITRWDPKAKKYCGWSADNFGYTSIGSGTYDEATRTWHFKGKSHNPMTGEKSVGEGKAVMVDDDTQEWTWTEWDPWKLRKLMELKGTSHRK